MPRTQTGQRGLGGALAEYGPGVVADAASGIGSSLGRSARKIGRGVELLGGDYSALLPEIGEQPGGETVGQLPKDIGLRPRKGVVPDEAPAGAPEQPTAGAPSLPVDLAGQSRNMAQGRGALLLPGQKNPAAARARLPEIGANYNDREARAGVAARAHVPAEIGPIDPLSLSAASMESDAGAQNMINARYRQKLASIDIGDPYLRAREAEAQAGQLNAQAEGAALVPEDNAPDTSVYQEGGTYKNKRTPRFTGGEYKAQLGKQLDAELAIGRAAAPEQAKAATEDARRNAFLKSTQQEVISQARAQEQQLRGSMKGDQLELALQNLKKDTAGKLHQALVESFAIGARFNVDNTKIQGY